MFLGRHAGLPVALEGALKLKEIAYIPATPTRRRDEARPDRAAREGTPVVSWPQRGAIYEKQRSNVEQVKARGGAHATAIATEGAAGAIADER